MLDTHLPVRPVLRAIVALIVLVLVAPWVVGSILATAAHLVRTASRAFRAGRAAFVDFVACPRGHRSELHGIFECRCGALFAGWAFEKCPVCAESCGYVGCEHCGLAVRNPVLVVLERGDP